MAPSTAHGTPSQDTDNTDNDPPTWDTSPNTFPSYYQDLLVWLPKQGSRFRLLVQLYVALDRGLTCCMSDNHALRVSLGLIAKGSFSDPFHVTSAHMGRVPPSGPPPSGSPSPPAASAGAPASSASSGSSTSATAPTTVNHASKPMVVEQTDADFWRLLAPTPLSTRMDPYRTMLKRPLRRPNEALGSSPIDKTTPIMG